MRNDPGDPATWVAYAEDDLETARRMLAPPRAVPRSTCFNAQQSAEKFLKAYLVFRKAGYPRTHDLDHLQRLCQKIEPAFGQIRLDCEELNMFGASVRYPAGDSSPVEEPEGVKALNLAQRIAAFVRERLPGHT